MIGYFSDLKFCRRQSRDIHFLLRFKKLLKNSYMNKDTRNFYHFIKVSTTGRFYVKDSGQSIYKSITWKGVCRSLNK